MLRRRGIAWSAGRITAWLLGLASLAVVTSTGLATLGMALFSVHMAQHMVLSMLTPILLLLGAPITLALLMLLHFLTVGLLFFGVVVMQAGYPLSTMFAASTTALGLDPIADQATGGGIAWGSRS